MGQGTLAVGACSPRSHAFASSQPHSAALVRTQPPVAMLPSEMPLAPLTYQGCQMHQTSAPSTSPAMGGPPFAPSTPMQLPQAAFTGPPVSPAPAMPSLSPMAAAWASHSLPAAMPSDALRGARNRPAVRRQPARTVPMCHLS